MVITAKKVGTSLFTFSVARILHVRTKCNYYLLLVRLCIEAAGNKITMLLRWAMAANNVQPLQVNDPLKHSKLCIHR